MGLSFFVLLVWRLEKFQQNRVLSCLQPGRRVSQLSCVWNLKNPRNLLDQKWGFQNPVKSIQKSAWLVEEGDFKKKWMQKIFSKTVKAPTFLGFQKAIWTGDLSHLPFWLVEKYRERGLLPVLALSGQHVWALLLCLDLVILAAWRSWGKPQGNFLLKTREWRVPLLTAWLFSLASNEPSMIRTAVSAGMAFFLRKLPVHHEMAFVFLLSFLGFLIFFPEQISSRGFILSAWGMLGVCVVNQCFSPRQSIRKGLWLWIWLVPLVAGFFGVCLGKGFHYTWVLSGVWEHLILPLLFALGILLIILPKFLSDGLASLAEILLNFWLQLEGSDTENYLIFTFRPSPLEVGLFSLWLVALAYWNRRVWLLSQKNVPTARHPLL